MEIRLARKPTDFDLKFALTQQQTIIALGGLRSALRQAMIIKADEVAAAFATDREAQLRTFDGFIDALAKETKSLAPDGATESEEAIGLRSALQIITKDAESVRNTL
jgi:hypothetical protein